MATTTEWIEKQDTPTVVSGIATIDNGETDTLPIPCHGRNVVRLQFPSAFTGTTVTFTVQSQRPDDPASPTVDPPFVALRDQAGNAVSYTIGTSRVVTIPELAGAYAFTIVSGSAEGAARQIRVSCVGASPTLPGGGNISSVTGTVTANQGTKTATASNAWLVQGGDAVDAALTNAPVVTGGRASNATPTAVNANNDVQAPWLSREGAAVIAGAGAIAASLVTTTAVGLWRIDNASTVPLAVIQAPWAFVRITTATTTVVKNAAGVLHALTIPIALTGAVTVYDNTSAAGTVLTVLPIGTVGTLYYDSAMATGITVVTAANDEVTALYR